MLLPYSPPAPSQTDAARFARKALAGWGPLPDAAQLLTQEFPRRVVALVKLGWSSLEATWRRQSLLRALRMEGRLWGLFSSSPALGPLGPMHLTLGGSDKW